MECSGDPPQRKGNILWDSKHVFLISTENEQKRDNNMSAVEAPR